MLLRNIIATLSNFYQKIANESFGFSQRPFPNEFYFRANDEQMSSILSAKFCHVLYTAYNFLFAQAKYSFHSNKAVTKLTQCIIGAEFIHYLFSLSSKNTNTELRLLCSWINRLAIEENIHMCVLISLSFYRRLHFPVRIPTVQNTGLLFVTTKAQRNDHNQGPPLCITSPVIIQHAHCYRLLIRATESSSDREYHPQPNTTKLCFLWSGRPTWIFLVKSTEPVVSSFAGGFA